MLLELAIVRQKVRMLRPMISSIIRDPKIVLLWDSDTNWYFTPKISKFLMKSAILVLTSHFFYWNWPYHLSKVSISIISWKLSVGSSFKMRKAGVFSKYFSRYWLCLMWSSCSAERLNFCYSILDCWLRICSSSSIC